jgi:predicted transcriptional regulator of viral defense system
MKYQEFRAKFAKLPYFQVANLNNMPDAQTLRVQLVEWVKKGYVIKLRQGLYTLRNKDRDCKVSMSFLANAIYQPSYLSLEWALQYYGFIPEAVFAATSITTKKTASFHNTFGSFYYKNLKIPCFNYFQQKKDEYGNNYLIATPEKALLDFLYLRTMEYKQVEEDIFEENFRLQNLDDIKISKLREIAKIYGQNKFKKVVEMLIYKIKEGDL